VRIVVDPPDLRDVATRFVDAAADVEQLSLRLVGAPRPELPAGFGDLDPTITSVSRGLQDQSTQLLRGAVRLRERAALAQLAAAIAYALREPQYEHLHGKRLHDALEKDQEVRAALTALSLANSVTDLVAENRKWERLEQIAMARGSWNTYVNSSVLRYGENDYRTFRGYMIWQERISHSMPLDLARKSIDVAGGSRAEDELASETGPLVKLGKLGRVIEVGGKGLTGVDALLGAKTAILGSDYHGVRGDVDRGMGGMSALAGAALLAGAVLPIPVAGEVAATVILTVGGLWAAGNLIADNKKAIARGLTATGKSVYDHTLVAAVAAPETAPIAVGKEIYDHRHDVERAGSTVAHGLEHVGSGALHLAGKALPWH